MGQHSSSVRYVRPRGTTPTGAKPLAFAIAIVAVAAIAFVGSSHVHVGSGHDGIGLPDSLALPPEIPAVVGIPAPAITPATPKPAGPKPHPGSRRVRFGATLRMRAHHTGDGENIVQKGFASGGSGYKLQVDGVKGIPSCAVVGTSSDRMHLVKASVPVDDGAWHTIACDMHGGVLSITVDGIVRGRQSVPTTLVVADCDQLRIGGKGTNANNGYFDGELHDVWVTIGS